MGQICVYENTYSIARLGHPDNTSKSTHHSSKSQEVKRHCSPLSCWSLAVSRTFFMFSYIMSFCISFCSTSWIHKQVILYLDYFPLSCEGTETSGSLPCSEGTCYLHFQERRVSWERKKWYRYKDGKNRSWVLSKSMSKGNSTKNMSP